MKRTLDPGVKVIINPRIYSDGGPLPDTLYVIQEIIYDVLDGSVYAYLGQKNAFGMFKMRSNVIVPTNGKLWIHESELEVVSEQNLKLLEQKEEYELAGSVYAQLCAIHAQQL